jgi:hypothetical protein
MSADMDFLYDELDLSVHSTENDYVSTWGDCLPVDIPGGVQYSTQHFTVGVKQHADEMNPTVQALAARDAKLAWKIDQLIYHIGIKGDVDNPILMWGGDSWIRSSVTDLSSLINLESLKNVNNLPTIGNILYYEGSYWYCKDLKYVSKDGTHGINFTDLKDVSGTPSANSIPRRNGSNTSYDFVNLSSSDISNSSTISGSLVTDALNNIDTELTDDTNEINGVINNTSSDLRTSILSLVSNYSTPRGYIDGLISSRVSQVSDAWAIHILEGICKDSGNSIAMSLPEFNKRVVASGGMSYQSWALGNSPGIGGVASSVTITDGQWLHLFVIGNKSTYVIDAGLDNSISATNLKTDTGWGTNFCYRRVGSIYIYLDTVYKIRYYDQIGDDFYYEAYSSNPAYSPSLVGTTWQAINLPIDFCPTDVSTIVFLNFLFDDGFMCASGSLSTIPSSTMNYRRIYPTSGVVLSSFEIITGISRNFYMYPLVALPGTMGLYGYGYRDFRGKQ